LRERLDSGADLKSFTDAEALEALDHIIRHKPIIVALDHEFSSTSRGTALINRIKDDPSLRACEVRVIANDGDLSRRPEAPGGGGAGLEPKAPLDQRGTRRAPRVRIKDGVEVMADGNPATLVNLSIVGAQIVSKTVLKPNQRVRLVMGDGPFAVRCNGSIAWASFEMPKGGAPRYRAGVDFIVADAEAVAAFASQHKGS
jgi:hypothetical protein